MAAMAAMVLGLTSCVEKSGFADVDSNGNGSISSTEFDSLMLEAMYVEVDTNRDGKISFEESKAANPGVDKAKFKALDTDGSGAITPQETKAQLASQGSMAGLFKQLDTDGNGSLSKQEWATFKKNMGG